MSVEAIAEQEPQEKSFVSTPFPESYWGRFLYGLFMIVMPGLAFWSTNLFLPEWQTGELSAYVILLLSPEASLLFFILIAYAIVCYCLLLADTAHYVQLYAIRLGIYTGVLLAVQYTVLSGLFFFTNVWNSFYLLVLWLFPVFSPRIYTFSVNKWGAKTVNSVLGTVAGFVFLVSAVIMKSPLYPLLFVLAGLTVAAPFWCFLLLLRAAIWLFKHYKFSPTFPRGLGFAAWIAGYAAAWRFDILKMYELYAALPPQPPPDCYIATAAAQGHPQVVGSWLVQRTDGNYLWVNRQLQILKCAELALMAVQPRLHKTLRRSYDVVGKILATKMNNPFLADFAYLLLKPLDGFAHFVLHIIIPEIDLISKRMYTK